MKALQLFGLLLLMTCGTSCVFYTDAIEQSTKINTNNAVLYGRFYYGHHFSEESNPAWYTTGLWIRNEINGRPLYIEFKDTNYVYAVEVKPGTYHIAGFVRSDNEHGVKQRGGLPHTNIPPLLREPFMAKPGDQIYIGDYLWETKLDYPLIYWNLKGIRDNFEETTGELFHLHPKLSANPSESIFNQKVHLR